MFNGGLVVFFFRQKLMSRVYWVLWQRLIRQVNWKIKDVDIWLMMLQRSQHCKHVKILDWERKINKWRISKTVDVLKPSDSFSCCFDLKPKNNMGIQMKIMRLVKSANYGRGKFREGIKEYAGLMSCQRSKNPIRPMQSDYGTSFSSTLGLPNIPLKLARRRLQGSGAEAPIRDGRRLGFSGLFMGGLGRCQANVR